MSFAASYPRWIAETMIGGTELTRCEKQVLKLLALGHNEVQIADKLQKSYNTVRKQTKTARARLRANTNAHAVAIAVSLDLI